MEHTDLMCSVKNGDLAESNRLLNLAEQIAHVGHWRLEIPGFRRTWSDETYRIFGFQPGTTAPRFAARTSGYHPDDLQRVRARLKAGARKGTDDTFEARVLRAHGETRNVLIRSTCEKRDGRVTAIFGVIIDVTEQKRAEARIREAEGHFKLLVDGISDAAVYVLDPNGMVTNWNNGAQRITGYAAADIVGRHFSYCLTEDDCRAGLPAKALEVAQLTGRYDCECQGVRKDGTFFWASFVLQPLRNESGILVGFSKITRDVTERKIAEEELRRSEARYRLIAEHTTDLIVQADLDSTRLYVSPASWQLLGYEPKELLGTTAFDLLHKEDKETFRNFLNELKSGARERGLTRQRYQHKDGFFIWCETTYRSLVDPKTKRVVGYVASIRDISERHAAAERAAYLATHDSLTGLPNRTLFQQCLVDAIYSAKHRGTPFALLWLDLDRFKFVNDSFGHPFGDRLLCEIGTRIRLAAGSEDIVARIGGDEFAILQRNARSAPDTASLARRVIDAVSEPFETGAHVLNVGASVGIVTAPEHGCEVDELFRKVDVALYRAKSSSQKSFCFFTPTMDVAARNRLSFEIEIRDAISDGSFHLEYQPIVHIETQSIVACEALLRWHHPTRGPIPPSDFIPIAEESGLIISLGAWVLHEACREAALWASDISVAVNVSACQFLQPGLEESVASALGQSGLLASRLVLEITESVLIRDSDAVLASLRRLHASGVKISLDDFGTGYSSLSYVHQFPFDKIKIDRSFVQAMHERGASTIVCLVAELGRQLDMTVVAEGVETQEQLEQIRIAGCREYQGYLFSKSISADRFKALVAKTTTVFAAS